jgi:hypothetical protein
VSSWLLPITLACAPVPPAAPEDGLPIAPQPLRASDLDALRGRFNAAREQPRVLVLLSAS